MTILVELLNGHPGRFLPGSWSALAAVTTITRTTLLVGSNKAESFTLPTGANGQIELISDGERLWIHVKGRE